MLSVCLPRDAKVGSFAITQNYHSEEIWPLDVNGLRLSYQTEAATRTSLPQARRNRQTTKGYWSDTQLQHLTHSAILSTRLPMGRRRHLSRHRAEAKLHKRTQTIPANPRVSFFRL